MSRNIFLLGRQRGLEDQLTEMLVWLISAVPEVGDAIVRLGFGDLDFDLGELEVTTQHRIAGGRLDAFVRSESLVLVIESKLGSAYGEGQLGAYIDWLATQHKDVAHKALMTLTAYKGPWPADDVVRAARVDVVASPRRWRELYTALSSLTSALDDLPARLVQEFLDMLGEERLIQVEPLQGAELADAWSRSRAIIERYHAYFGACIEAFEKGFQATPGGRARTGVASAWLEFRTPDGEKFMVMLEDSDRNWGISSPLHRDTPIISFAVEAPEWPNWQSASVKLAASPPEGWRKRARWYGYPCVWRHLDDVVRPGSLDEQRAQLAAAAAQMRDWLLSANTSSPVDSGLTKPAPTIAADPDPD